MNKLSSFFGLLSASLLLITACDSDKKTVPTEKSADSVKQKTFVNSVQGKEVAVNGQGLKYVTSAACTKCHAGEVAKWKESHHHAAMEADHSKFLADFSGEFEHLGEKVTFSRTAEGLAQFTLTVPGQEKSETFLVHSAIGITPLQQYVLKMPDGKLQCFPVAWDELKKKWMVINADRKLSYEDDWLHWKNSSQNWNSMCAECHVTGYEKNFDGKEDYHSSWQEFNVSCESCHGSAVSHLEKHGVKGFASRVTSKFKSLKAASGSSSTREVDTCAACHSRRSKLTSSQGLSGEFHDHFLPSPILPDLYEADGQILDEVFVWGSFTQSRMSHMGIRCSNCHDPHSQKLIKPGNSLCTQCHVPETYDVPSHTLHAAGVSGASCVACHMPGKVYMGNDYRRDHSFRIPRPDLTVKFGVSNACNECHTKKDQDAQWAVNILGDRLKKDHRSLKDHHGQYFAEYIKQGSGTDKIQQIVDQGENYSGTVRSSAFELLRWNGQLDLARVNKALEDEDPLMRLAAASFYAGAPLQQRVSALLLLLDDKYRSVRIRAAEVLNLPDNILGQLGAYSKKYKTARTEMEAYYLENEERASIHFSRGLQAQQLKKTDEAERHYRRSLEIDSRGMQSLGNLAWILSAKGGHDEAITLLERAVDTYPGNIGMKDSLARVFAIAKKPEKGLELLRKEFAKGNATPSLYSLAGEIASRIGVAEQEKVLLEGVAKYSQQTDLVENLCRFYLLHSDKEKCLLWLDRLELCPGGTARAAALRGMLK